MVVLAVLVEGQVLATIRPTITMPRGREKKWIFLMEERKWIFFCILLVVGIDTNETGLFLEKSGKIVWDLNF